MVVDERRGFRETLRERAGTVRVRTTTAAVVVVGLALVAAALAMVILLKRSLTDDVRAAALLRADAVAELLSAGEDDGPVRIGDQEEEFVQVVDSGGRVTAASANVQGEPAILRLEPGRSREVSGLRFEDDSFLVVARSASTPQGSHTILVGRTLETVAESTQAVGSLLLVGLPILLIVVAGTTWAVAGRALAPVEAIRAEVDAISSRELHRRVPDPPGTDEIARLATTMNKMLARLQKGQAQQRRFVSDAAHELRSPVAAIRQQAEIALTHPERTTIEELGRVVFDEDERLERIVDDLLLLARIDETTLRPEMEPVDLDDLVLDEVDRLREATDLRVDISGVSAGRVSGVRAQLAKLVRNIAENAARHARGAVALSLTEDEKETVLTIDDDGAGVPPADRKRVFDRFVRLDEARDRDSGGSGLGLAIVAEIAAVHGGSAAALDSPLGGARVEVRLPRLDD
ncbi:MAG: ATP-binding protein [Actinomycetota bacterium]|nr:ATP-binding protein [Actinomycetota bacterium]